MNYSIIDSKLKSLIVVCKETGNNKKLAVVSFILVSNILDEIGIKLGIRPRKKNRPSEEHIFQYMKLINSILTKSLKITLFNEDLISELEEIEQQFLKKKGNIPFEYIKKIFESYYNIRKLDIPNLHETFKDELNGLHNETDLYSLMATGNVKNKQPNKVKSLILHKIREKEVGLQNELRRSYDKGLFESALYLQNVKSSLKNGDKKKFELEGPLKNNVNYQISLDAIFGYFLIGVVIIFFLLGFIITIETIFHPSLTGTISPLFLATYGMATLFFILYWNYFKKED